MMLILAALITVASMFLTIHKFGPNALKRAFGYDKYIDVGMGFFTTVIFGMTATITGVLIAVMTGLMIGLCLAIGKKVIGYQVLERTGPFKWTWVEYPGEWQRTKAKVPKAKRSMGFWFTTLVIGPRAAAKKYYPDQVSFGSY